MSAGNLIDTLARQGVELWLEGEQLRYRAPKSSLPAELVDRLREQKTEIIAHLQSRANLAEPFPLTAGQRALWFLHQANPGSAAYNIRFAVELAAGTDSALLDRSLRLLVGRHPMLRTCFKLLEGEPRQFVRQDLEWGLTEATIQDPDEMTADADRQFDLEAGPICRVTRFRLAGEARTFLQICAHHIGFDFAALGILITELRTCYSALRSGSTPQLPRLTTTFREHVESEIKRLAGEQGERSRRYWRQMLAGSGQMTLALPTDKPRPDRQSWQGATHQFYLDEALVQRLRGLARQEGATLYALFLTAYQVLLFRHAHHDDLLIGTPVSGRNRPGMDAVVGYFSNPVVLRGTLSGQSTFRQLLAQTRQSVLDAMEHGDYPFVRLLEELKIERDGSRSPVFQTTFVWDQRNEELPPGYPGDPLYTDRFTSEQRGANYDLSLTIYDVAGPMRVALAYSTALFLPATILRLGRHFVNLLQSIAETPDGGLDHLSLEPPPRLFAPAPAPLSRSWPLSFHQERIWFIDLFETGKIYEGRPTYHDIPAVVEFSAPLDTERLTHAFALLRKRHALIECYVRQEGEGWNLEQCEQSPFLWADIGANRLSLTVHHFIADAYTVRLLLDEWLALYQDPAANLPLAPQYGDYARMQRAMPLDSLRLYWFHKLRGRLQPLVLPYDRPRAPIHIYEAGSLTCEAPSADEVVLLAAYIALLRRYSGQEEIILGYADAGRTGFEAMVGPVSNLLVLRAQVNRGVTGNGLIRHVTELLASAQAHRDMPFDRLVTELNPEKDMSRTALFDVLFSYHDALDFIRDLGGVTARYRAQAIGYGKYDLHLDIHDGRAQLVFNRKLFDESTAEGMLRHWARMVGALSQNLSVPIDEIELLDDNEVAQQLETWNGSDVGWPRDANLAQLFRECAARFPERIALTCNGRAMSYRDLDQRSDHLAALLIAEGVQPQELVALLLDREPMLPVAILGVLKAGAAYLPLDPSTPPARLQFVIEDAGCERAVTQSHLQNSLPKGVRPIVLDHVSQTDVPPPDVGVLPEHLAYCIYTSGSTGRPKGVLLEHAQVVRLFFNDAPLFDFNEHDVWTLFHSCSFDFSVWELFGALLFGGRLVIVPSDTAANPAAMLDLLEEERVTVLNQTPSAFAPLAEEGIRNPRRLALRQIIFGGQQLDPVKLKPWNRTYPDVRLINMYGITETCVHVTYREIEAADMDRAVSPIGRPIPTMRTCVVDSNLRLVPRGVTGELLVGGAGVARGYLHRDELTCERFIADPFRPGERVYRSGDLVRQLNDGQLVYLGRADDQLQLRGFRVELGEIRHALLKQPSVADAWVTPYGSDRDPSLAAYIVPRMDAREYERRLARFERERPDRKWSRMELPNGVLIVQTNPTEVEFTYNEIFEERSYLRHGVELPDNAVIFDVGANIGLFSLFAGLTCRNARIFAFEPIPETFEMLRLNAGLYDFDITALNQGLGSRPHTATFTYYPHVSIFSGLFADTEAERNTIRAFIRNSGERNGHAGPSDEEVELLLQERFRGVPVTCRVRTVSQAIKEYGLDRIDLLKVDAEKSELDILQGIEAGDWPRIRQIVLEAHDIDGRVERIERLLRSHGFQVAIEQQRVLADTHLFNMGAVRRAAQPPDPRRLVTKANPMQNSSAALIRELRTQLRRELPEYMIPSSLVLLDSLPVTANGKIDTARLPSPVRANLTEAEFVAPRGPLEERIAEIWREVLGVSQVGIHDDFFDLGGHSLLVTRLTSRLRQEFAVEVPVHAVFQGPTVAENAEFVQHAQLAARPEDEMEFLLAQVESLPEEEVLRRMTAEGAQK